MLLEESRQTVGSNVPARPSVTGSFSASALLMRLPAVRADMYHPNVIVTVRNFLIQGETRQLDSVEFPCFLRAKLHKDSSCEGLSTFRASKGCQADALQGES